MNKNIILIVVILLIVLLTRGVQENLGSDFFHRGKLAEVNQAIQKQVAKYNKKKQEEFNIPFFKKKQKPTEPQHYNPNENVISKYSFKTIKPKDAKPLDKVQVGMLESPDFVKPVDYTEEKKIIRFCRSK